MPLIVFDLDGTLADTSTDLLVAANRALAADGYDIALDLVSDAAIAFRGGRAMLREGLARIGADTGQADTMYDRLLGFYREDIDQHTRLYPGAIDAIEELSAAGWDHAICTNKPIDLAEQLLQRLDIRHHFKAVLGGDSLDVRKPDPRHLTETIAASGGRVAEAVMIGDTDSDSKAAKAAHIPCVLVGFGPAGAAVKALEPDAILWDYADLNTILIRFGKTLPGLVPKTNGT